MSVLAGSTSALDRSSGIRPIVGSDLYQSIRGSKVLMVGAGGIGCELLKNLVLTGFTNITVVDLDTIEVSNLNRQFLFQRQHVGLPKAQVAAESALKFNPHAQITYHHGNIKDKAFDVDFFSGFDLVLNALDNISARNHVNRMCLAANRPLVESGTAGYLGQVTVILKGETECFECQPKPPPKQHPVCTIRNTPSLPIHCIVWGKFLFNQLFGHADDENNISPNTADPEARPHGEDEQPVDGRDLSAAQAEQDQAVYKAPESLRSWAESQQHDGQAILQKLFVDDIQTLLNMDRLWKERRPPARLDSLQAAAEPSAPAPSGGHAADKLKDQRVWDVAECVSVFLSSTAKLSERYLAEKAKAGADAELSWDKDDDVAMDFVTAAANLRMSNFGIPRLSRFDAKSMAGNIIPAIATTNAVIAGLIVLETIKLLGGKRDQCRTTYLTRKPNARKKLLMPTSLEKPNPQCFVCASKPEVTIQMNLKTATLGQLEEAVLKARLGMIAPDVTEGQRIILSSEPGETTGNNHKTLHELGVEHGSVLFAEDFHQTYELSIRVAHAEQLEGDALFHIVGDALAARPQEATSSKTATALPAAESTTTSTSDSSAMMVVDDDDIAVESAPPATLVHGASTPASLSRKRRASDDQGQQHVEEGEGVAAAPSGEKRARLDAGDDSDVIEL